MDEFELAHGKGMTVSSVVLADQDPVRHVYRVHDATGTMILECATLAEVGAFAAEHCLLASVAGHALAG